MKPLLRTVVLEDANRLITVERAKEHGDAHENFQVIADYWSTCLGIKIRPAQVCDCMELLKLARRKSNPRNIENSRDGAGYAALSYELDNDT